MDWKSASLILIAGLNLGSAFVVYFTNPKSRINIYYSAFIFCIAMWAFGLAFLTATPMQALYTHLFTYCFAGLIPVFFYLFSIYFPYQIQEFTAKTKALIWGSVGVLCIGVLLPLFISGINIDPPNTTIVLNLFSSIIFSVIFLSFTLAGFRNLIIKFFNSGGFTKTQLQSVIYGSLIAFFFGIVFDLIYPYFGSYQMIWFGPCFTVVMVLLLNYLLFFQSRTVFKVNFDLVVVSVFFTILTLWWVILLFILDNPTGEIGLIWGASYQLVALFGALLGFITAKSYENSDKKLTIAIIAFSLGLLLQVFGQNVYSFYVLVLQVVVPYPSLGDLGFFGSIPCYIVGIYLLGKSIQKKSGLHKRKTIVTFTSCLILLIISYPLFINGYSLDWSNKVKTFFDFGYPIGQAIYVSLALSILFSLKKKSGVIRISIFFILIALVVQYIADYNFLYQAAHLTWISNGYGDYIYLLAYFIMTIGLIQLGADDGRH